MKTFQADIPSILKGIFFNEDAYEQAQKLHRSELTVTNHAEFMDKDPKKVKAAEATLNALVSKLIK